jgi:DNA-binding NarL/FixJ family response regulator
MDPGVVIDQPPPFTTRELEVIDALAGGARSLSEIARALDPPISWRTVEAHVIACNAKIRADFEPRLTPYLRVLVWVLTDGTSVESE